MTALSAAALRAGPRTMGSARAVRLVAFGTLALYAGAHWATIVEPAAHGALLAMFAIAVATGVTADAARAIPSPPVRAAALAGAAVVGLGAVLLTAGAPLGLLRPDHWGQLADEITDGLRDLPAVRVPYSGRDPWLRTVLLSGGGLLLLGGAALALRARAHAFAAAVCLGVLYTVPIVEHGPGRPWLDGAIFALLLGICLWGDRLRRADVPLAAGLGVVVLLAAVVTAPRLDTGQPWIDYESLAESLQSGSSTTFSWNHDYGPLDWPRTGVELARVTARGKLYFKTADLERFDGVAWRQERAAIRQGGGDTEIDARHPEWRQSIHVRIRDLRTRQFLGAGTTIFVRRSSRPVHEATPGTFEVDDKLLRRGDAYDATVYYPQPSVRELRAAGTDYPAFVSRQLTVDVPASRATGSFGPVRIGVTPWGTEAAMTALGANGLVNVDPRAALAASPYARAWTLARALRRASIDPYDFVRRVVARVQDGARYTESPPAPGRMAPLEAFLFRDRAGFCQHFAGATALLLRMGGVPARVVAGFSPGSRADDGQRVIRDFDAHSWVEVYFPRIGWVTVDPTPGDSPARSQLTDRGPRPAASPAPGAPATTAVAANPTPGQARGRDEDPQRASGDGPAGGDQAPSADGGGGAPAALLGALLALAALGAGAVLAARRRGRLARSGDPELEELRLALVRTGRAPEPGVTLHRLERLLAGSADARAYVRALRLARYGPAAGDGAGVPRGPTPAQRRALRRELAAGLGLAGRARALTALPPRPDEVFERFRRRRGSSYTA